MKILVIFGTRPAAIKLLPVVKELQKHSEFKPIVCVTGQHRDMLDQVLSVFKVIPDIDLDIMRHKQDLFDVSATALIKLRAVLKETKPDFVLVQGDTTTCFVAALAAFYLQIPVGHVEAGLRTYNLKAPFPEEGNRALVSRIVDLHFAPTKIAEHNLLQERIDPASIVVTGNTVIDTLLKVKEYVSTTTEIVSSLSENIQRIIKDGKTIILITGHRRENFGSHLEEICSAFATIATRHPDWQLIYPVHLNPNVRGPVLKLLSPYKNIHLLEPVDYLTFVYLMTRSSVIITDSGGIQEEAPSLGKPVLVTRETTERVEAVEAGAAVLVGCSHDRIVAELEDIMRDKQRYAKMSCAKNPYGEGKASRSIIEALERFFCKTPNLV